MPVRNAKSRLIIALYTAIICAFSLLGFGDICGRFARQEINLRKSELGYELSDFATFYAGGIIARNNWTKRAPIYSAPEQKRVQDTLAAPKVLKYTNYVAYPPYCFSLMAALTFMPLDTAWLVWCAVTYALSFATLLLASKRLVPDFTTRLCITLLTFASAPVWIALCFGDTSFLLLTSVMLFWALLEGKRPMAAAFGSVLTLVKAQYAPFVLIAGATFGRTKFLIGYAIMGAVISLFTWANLGLENILAFPSAIKTVESPGVIGSNPHLFQTLRGCLYIWAGSQDTHINHIISLIAFLLSLGTCFWLWMFFYPKYREREERAMQVCASITVLGWLIFSLHTYNIDYIVLGVVAMLLWEWLNNTTKSKAKQGIKTLLILTPFLTWVFSIAYRIIVHSLFVQPYALLDFALLLLICLEASRKDGMETQPIEAEASSAS